MLPAEYHAAVRRWQGAFAAYARRAEMFALKAGDCVGRFPTDEDFSGTRFRASICYEQ